MGIKSEIRRLADAILANGMSVGEIAATTLKGDLTKDSTDLSIAAASTKNVIIKLGDAAGTGAKKISITDSAGTEEASITSAGILTAKKVVAPVSYATAETSGAPTNAECVSAFGAAASVGAGFVGVLQDTATDGVSYLCVSNGTNYDVFTGVGAV